MTLPRFHQINSVFKWAITLYLLLTCLGFGVAALISRDRYDWDHDKTVVFYRGNEEQMAYPKTYGELIQTAHVHSFTMPLVFLMIWLGLSALPLRRGFQITVMLGGALAILLYNGAPFFVRYLSASYVWLFTIGGVGLFIFYYLPALLILWEIWFGFRRK
jgi:hypothetical protein